MPYEGDDSSYGVRLDGSTSRVDEYSDDGSSRYTSTYSNMDGSVSSRGTRPGRDYMDPVVAEKEQRAVFVSRLVMLLVIFIALAALSLTMYFLIARDEEDEFETQFLNYASEMSSIARQNAQTTIETVKAFSTAVTSHALSSGSEWPFVSLPNYSLRAHELAMLTASTTVQLCPIVHQKDLGGWINYSMTNAPMMYQEAIDLEGYNRTVASIMAMTFPAIFKVNFTDFSVGPEDRPGPWLPTWQALPMLPNGESGGPATNYNILNGQRPNVTFYSAYTTGLPTLDFLRVPLYDGTGRWIPESQIMQPVFSDIPYPGKPTTTLENEVVAIIWLRLNWATYFENLLPVEVNGIFLVLESTCAKENEFGASVYTYEINGLDAVPYGEGDQHDPKYDYLGVTQNFVTLDYDKSAVPPGQCISELIMKIYPSQKFEDSFYTNDARNYSLGVVFIFVFTTLVFGIYDYSVRARQYKVMARVSRQHKIVSDVFPSAIRDKLYNAGGGGGGKRGGFDMDMAGDGDLIVGGPLAELYPNVTVAFADIVGFTAWSSAREPSQVFELLESLYREFDRVAYRHGVFKVETVGDCYVAVGGLPEVRPDHAVIVAKFARDCLHKMKDITRVLEMTLGPDTADLDLRLGLHTGQVTAGVLRGERSRFQLFGDTVNTASRMEATSSRRRIQISSSTAAELENAGLSRWISPRNGKVAVKGKGNMQTYWLHPRGKRKRDNTEETLELSEESSPLQDDAEIEDDDDDDDYSTDERLQQMTKTDRLVEWHVEVLGNLLRQIMASRSINGNHHAPSRENLTRLETSFNSGRSTVLDEFKDIITLPMVDDDEIQKRKENAPVHLDPVVVSELRSFLTVVAALYRPNPFHNFEHASHVTSSVRKLLTRIVSAGQSSSSSAQKQQQPHHHPETQLVDRAGRSFGITSDPLTQFAVVFSAIIHDADHPGVTNSQLVKEGTEQAILYKKSIAEQNSVDLVWDLLMTSDYSHLRACIYTTEDELLRFRQLIVNIVLATDIVDKELQNLRKARWEKAFSETNEETQTTNVVNRKATIVLEHLIQASDVAHTMQHWQIYKRWNERFFMECYGAYKAGRSAGGGDPSVGWYKGEIGFFDFYVIPLAKKLDRCGVFGVSSDEYLNYAQSNRDEWVREGENLVQEYLHKFQTQGCKKDDDSHTDPLSNSLTSAISASSHLSV